MNPSLGRALPFPAGFFSSAAVPLPPGRFRGPKRLLRGPRGAAGGAAGAAGAPPAPGGAPAAGRRSTRAPHARPPGAAGGAPTPPARPRPRCPPARAAGLGVGQGGWPSPARRGLAVEPRRPRRGRGRPGRRGGGGGPGAAAAAPPPAARPAPRPAGARGEFGEFVFFFPALRLAAPPRGERGAPSGSSRASAGAGVTCHVESPGVSRAGWLRRGLGRPAPRGPRPAGFGLRGPRRRGRPSSRPAVSPRGGPPARLRAHRRRPPPGAPPPPHRPARPLGRAAGPGAADVDWRGGPARGRSPGPAGAPRAGAAGDDARMGIISFPCHVRRN